MPPGSQSFRATFAIAAAIPLAGLLAAISLGGLLTHAYVRETPAWYAQAVGQDWFDLAIVTPWLVVCGFCAQRSVRWRVLLAGAYAYTVYELFIYAFAVHFNALFLVYCTTLGLAAFALLAALTDLHGDAPHIDRRAGRLGAGVLVGVAVIFALLWLAEDVPAVMRGEPPASLTETGLLTNPVHAIDLSFVLPAHVLAAVWLWQRRRTGEVYAPVLIAFGIVMASSIAGMLVVIRVLGGAAPMPIIVALFAVAAALAAVLARMLRTHTRYSTGSSYAAVTARCTR